MNHQLKKNSKEKPTSSLFRIFLVIEIIIGIGVLLYGMIQSNSGYPSLDRLRRAEKINGESISPTPRVVDKVDISKLKKAWPFSPDPSHRESLSGKLEQVIFQKINEERKKKRLSPLQWENGLAKTALYHSTDMGNNQFFDHQNLDNIGPSFRLGKLHRRYIGASGESITKMGKDTPDPGELAEKLVREWLNSTEHRENLLNESFNCLGVGCFETKSADQTLIYSTLIFGEKIGDLQNDFPQQTSPGQDIFIRVEIISPTYLPPDSIRVMNVEDRMRWGNFPLKADSKTISSGVVKTPAEEGIYQLAFPVPHAENSNTFDIVRGPLFVVKKKEG